MKYLITNPLNYFFASLALTILVLLLIKYSSKVKSWWLFPALAINTCFFILLTPHGANYLLTKVTLGDGSTDACQSSSAALIMDGLNRQRKHSADFGALNQESLSRLQASLEWLSERQENRVFVLGNQDENEIAESYFALHGISKGRYTALPSSSSPLTNAALLAETMDARNVVLVSSDVDSRRMQETFSSQGFETCPLITHSERIVAHPLRMMIPSADAVTLGEHALWEIVGLIWYQLK